MPATGTLYLAGNVSMPELYKIGFTRRPLGERMAELSRSSSVPTAFYDAHSIRTHVPSVVEKELHASMARLRAGKEFFRLGNDRDAILAFMLHLRNCPSFWPVTGRSVSAANHPKPKVEPVSPERQAASKATGRETIAQLRRIVGEGKGAV